MTEIERIAGAVGRYVMKRFVEPRLSRTVSYFTARVVTPADGGQITVQTFDGANMTIPCTGAAATLDAGAQCLVFALGDASNAIAFSDGMMSNIGSGGGGSDIIVTTNGTNISIAEGSGVSTSGTNITLV